MLQKEVVGIHFYINIIHISYLISDMGRSKVQLVSPRVSNCASRTAL